jgi:hypothetical protein
MSDKFDQVLAAKAESQFFAVRSPAPLHRTTRVVPHCRRGAQQW